LSNTSSAWLSLGVLPAGTIVRVKSVSRGVHHEYSLAPGVA
jgi:hypothetical protein